MADKRKQTELADRRGVLRKLAVIPAAAAIASCDRRGDRGDNAPPAAAPPAPPPPAPAPKPKAKARMFVNPPELQNNRSYSTVVRAGNHVYVTAQVPVDKDANVMFAGNVAEQVRQVWRQIEIAMKSVGGKLTDVVQCVTFVTREDIIETVGEVRAQVFPVNPPATSRPILVKEVTGIDPKIPVSITATGYIDD